MTKYNSCMPELPLEIRNYRAGDLAVLCEIDRLCFPEGIAFSRAEFVFYLNHPKSITRVAEGVGRILGFVIAREVSPAVAHVITLDVIPEARRKNIGMTLMNTLHEELERRKIGAALLEVGARNLPAQRLYEKLQYRYRESLPGYYGGGEDAYRMARRIQNRL
jgi:[ribosomal protein S18]-alanine N-acetyltransferase